jgi:hypothetical protein
MVGNNLFGQLWHWLALTVIEVCHKVIQLTRINCIAQSLHQTLVIPKVMNGIEAGPEDLITAVKMVQVRSRVILTGVTITLCI